ncbi:MAG: Uma2 family endonuclease [Leptospira sp.]|nr:Uma2 family endonuclease [Leptospira sp.]
MIDLITKVNYGIPMATVTQFEELIHPLSVDAYHLLYEKGLVAEKAELIEGVIFNKMPKNPIHSEILRRLNRYLYDVLSKDYVISSENPLTLGNSEPEPDISILPPGDYSSAHPNYALMVVEIANSSLSFDRKKAVTYAKGNIPEYVLINLNDQKIEFYQAPKDGAYTEIRILSKDEILNSGSIPGLSFTLEKFL